MSPLVLTYLDVEIILSELGFHIYISHGVTLICPFTVVTNEVILKNLSEIDFGGLMWGTTKLCNTPERKLFLDLHNQFTR